MKKLLIIYPHWYPSNLAGVHRARLVGNFLMEFGWQPIILTVKPEYYEEAPDPDMHSLFSPSFVEYRVDALKARKPRIIGDIGLRAFWQLYKKGKEIIATEKPDFLWIPIPSFYAALLGRFLHKKTGILYGIDYIDPWVRDISKDGSLRAKLSLWTAKLLEPIAVKKASLISGVAYEYYKPVLERIFGKKYKVLSTEYKEPGTKYQVSSIKYQDNKKEKQKAEDEGQKGEVRREGSDKENDVSFSNLQISNSKPQTPNSQILHCAFPYGFDPKDHEIDLPGLKLPWDDRPGCKPIVYAGAFMPNSQHFLNKLMEAIALLEKEQKIDSAIHFYFLGTGYYPHRRITDYAAEFGLQHRITEIRDRYPYLHILNFLKKSEKVMIIGSTEKHYTASKTFQVILSGRPVFAMFHNQSTACDILTKCNASKHMYTYDPCQDINTQELSQTFATFLHDHQWNPDYAPLENYSSRNGAKELAEAMDFLINNDTHTCK